MGGGKEMVDPDTVEGEPREFGDEIITGGMEKTKSSKKSKARKQYGSDDESPAERAGCSDSEKAFV